MVPRVHSARPKKSVEEGSRCRMREMMRGVERNRRGRTAPSSSAGRKRCGCR